MGILGTSGNVTAMGLLGTDAVVADLNLLGTSDVVADMALLANSATIADMAILATSDIVADLAILATSDVVADIALLATSDIVSDLNTLATSAIVTDLNILATSDIVTDINLLATSDIVSDLNTLATSDFVSDLNILASSTVVTNIATVAANVAGVNSFAARYRVAGSDPGADNDAGDLVFNTGTNILKVWNGSSFEDVTGTTLAGLNDVNVTSPADGSLLLYDTGTSKYIDNVISGDATLADTGVLTLTANSVDSDQYVDGSIDREHLEADIIDATKIADDAISEEHLDPTIISGLADTTIASADHIMFFDATDNALKKVDAGELIQTPTALRPNVQPLLINGDFKMAQRATSVSGITTTGLNVVDRWGYVVGDAGTWTAERANDGPAQGGFPQCFKWDVTTARSATSLTVMYIRQILEAQNCQLFNIAQATAKPFTVTFWVRSTKTGTFICMLNNFTSNRHVSKAYTVSSSNTWEKKTVSFPADTAGSIGNTEGPGISVNFWMTAGSTYAGGTLQQTWGSVVAANQAVGQVNCADSTSNFFSLAGVQFEVGEYDATTVPDFQHENYPESLMRCHRYYIHGSGNTSLNPTAEAASATTVQPTPQLRTPMRVAPTLVARAVSFIALIGGSGNTTTLAFSNMGINGFRYGLNHDASITTKQNVAMGGTGADMHAEI